MHSLVELYYEYVCVCVCVCVKYKSMFICNITCKSTENKFDVQMTKQQYTQFVFFPCMWYAYLMATMLV